MAALGCDINRSMQHPISKYREEDVVDEAATQEVLYRFRDIIDVDRGYSAVQCALAKTAGLAIRKRTRWAR